MQNGKIKIIKRQQIEAFNSQTISAETSHGKPNISDIRREMVREAREAKRQRQALDMRAFFGLQSEAI